MIAFLHESTADANPIGEHPFNESAKGEQLQIPMEIHMHCLPVVTYTHKHTSRAIYHFFQPFEEVWLTENKICKAKKKRRKKNSI